MIGLRRVALSSEGPELSRLAYGVWRLLDDPEGSGPVRVREKIDACLAQGITTFDHADIYGGYRCEAAFGAALAEAPGLRDRIEIVTKCGIKPQGMRPGHRVQHYDYAGDTILASAHDSLRNLHTDRIDVLLLHRPSPLLDPDVVAESFSKLRAEGSVRHFGVSNFTPGQLSMLQSRLDFPLVTNQVEIHLLRLDAFLDGTLDQCIERRIAPMAWSPTAGGRIFQGDDETARRVRSTLEALADKYSAGVDQLLYAWLLRHPSRMVVVLGTNREERIESAVGAHAVDLELQDWFAVWSASTGEPVP